MLILGQRARPGRLVGAVLTSACLLCPTVAYAKPVPERLVGSYYVHAGTMTVRANGTISVTYQWYYPRDKGMPTYPRLSLKVQNVTGNVMKGTVTSQVKSAVTAGTRFTATQTAPGMHLRFSGQPRVWRFCDEVHKVQGACGA